MTPDTVFAMIPILGISCGLLAIFAGTIVRPWLKLKEGRLEERAAVLERIITDQGYSLAKEIEELRSLPPRSVQPQRDLI